MNDPQQGKPNTYPPPPGAYPGNAYPQSAYPQSYQQPAFQYQPLKPFSTYAILSMVMGGVGFLMMPLGALTGPLGILFGFIGMKEGRDNGGTHRGRGLAIGGLILSVISTLFSVALVVFFVWLFTFVDEHASQFPQEPLESFRYDVDEDLELFEDRLRLYYIENLRSFSPGGPMVAGRRDGETAISELPRIEGELKISDLVHSTELNNTLTDYTLEIIDNDKANITCRPAGRQLRVEYATSRYYNIGEIR